MPLGSDYLDISCFQYLQKNGVRMDEKGIKESIGIVIGFEGARPPSSGEVDFLGSNSSVSRSGL